MSYHVALATIRLRHPRQLSAQSLWVARLAFLTPNVTNLAFFRDTWRQKILFGFPAFSFQYLAFFKAVGTYHQTGVLA